MPPLPADIPNYTSAVAVSRTSGKAALIAKFFEWALTGRDGYDLVRYGAEGTDYRLEGEKIVYMDGGEDIPLIEIYDPSKHLLFFQSFSLFLL